MCIARIALFLFFIFFILFHICSRMDTLNLIKKILHTLPRTLLINNSKFFSINSLSILSLFPFDQVLLRARARARAHTHTPIFFPDVFTRARFIIEAVQVSRFEKIMTFLVVILPFPSLSSLERASRRPSAPKFANSQWPNFLFRLLIASSRRQIV